MEQDEPYILVSEAAKRVGLKRGTFLNYCHRLGIPLPLFGLKKRSYIAIEDIERLKEYLKYPWLIEEQVKPHGENTN